MQIETSVRFRLTLNCTIGKPHHNDFFTAGKLISSIELFNTSLAALGILEIGKRRAVARRARPVDEHNPVDRRMCLEDRRQSFFSNIRGQIADK